jgi:hypothetical protein
MMCGMSDPSDFPVYEPEPRLPVTLPPRPAGPGQRVGRAQGVQTRVEGRGRDTSSETVTTFRILDADGGQPAEVELRGRTLSGTVQEGDWVELANQRAKSGRYEVDRLTNLTTGSEVASPRGLPKAAQVILLVVFAIIFLTVLGFIIVGVMTMNSGF